MRETASGRRVTSSARSSVPPRAHSHAARKRRVFMEQGFSGLRGGEEKHPVHPRGGGRLCPTTFVNQAGGGGRQRLQGQAMPHASEQRSVTPAVSRNAGRSDSPLWLRLRRSPQEESGSLFQSYQ